MKGISYINLADKKVDNTTGKGKGIYQFTVDITKPTGKIKLKSKEVWENTIRTLTFSKIDRANVGISFEDDDNVSGIQKREYYIDENSNAKEDNPAAKRSLKESEIDKKGWKVWNSQEFIENLPKQFVVYYRITDFAGNRFIVQSDGIIIEGDEPSIDVKPVNNAPYNGYYNISYSSAHNGVVRFRIDVGDLKNVPSGIKSVSWVFTKDGIEQKVSNGTLYSFKGSTIEVDGKNKSVIQYDDIEKAYSLKPMYVDIPMAANNSNKIQVKVIAQDNAGNKTTAYSQEIKIDTVAPTITTS